MTLAGIWPADENDLAVLKPPEVTAQRKDRFP